jgi:hypothetical protein
MDRDAGRLQALDRANEVRRDKALLKDDLRRRRVSAVALLREYGSEGALGAFRVRELLMAQRGWGTERFGRCLRYAEAQLGGRPFDPRQRVRDLSRAERKALLAGVERCTHDSAG